MYKRRLIPVLFLKDGWMVRSEDFARHQYIGDPVAHVERMVEWNVDELIVVDIGNEDSRFDHHRTDYRFAPVVTILDFIRRAGVQCNIPLTFGGRIRSLDDIAIRILNGADKVTINTLLLEEPEIVAKAARTFGSQAIVASIDYRHIDDGTRAYVSRGKMDTGCDVLQWAKRAEDFGAGEILLNSIARDGQAKGYDLEVIAATADATRIPVIACGGAGTNEHFLEVFTQTNASAAAAGNIFHFKENAYPAAKSFLKSKVTYIR